MRKRAEQENFLNKSRPFYPTHSLHNCDFALRAVKAMCEINIRYLKSSTSKIIVTFFIKKSLWITLADFDNLLIR